VDADLVAAGASARSDRDALGLLLEVGEIGERGYGNDPVFFVSLIRLKTAGISNGRPCGRKAGPVIIVGCRRVISGVGEKAADPRGHQARPDRQGRSGTAGR
jgi:hypothetical protein